MKRLFVIFSLIAVIIGGDALMPAAALAQTDGELYYTSPNNGQMMQCPNTGIFTERVVMCVRSAIENMLTYFLPKLTTAFYGIVLATITLSLTLFGSKILAGAQESDELKKEGFMLMLKIGCILVYTNNFDNMHHALFDAMEELQTIVTSTIQPSGTLGCVPSDMGQPNIVWQRIDCLLGTLFGFGSNALATGAVSLFSAAFGSMALSTSVGLLTMGAMVATLLMVLRMVYIFLMGYSMVAFMIIMSPIMIPLILFQATARMFIAWLNLLVSFMLQPVVLFAALGIAVALLDTVTMGSGSLPSNVKSYKDLMLANDGEKMTDAQRTNVPIFGVQLQQDQKSDEALPAAAKENKFEAPALPTMINDLFKNGMNLNLFKVDTLDFGNYHFQTMQDLIGLMAAILIVSYFAYSFIQQVPDLTAAMVGSSFSLGLMQGQHMPLEKVITDRITGKGKAIEAASQNRPGLFGGGGVSGAVNNIGFTKQ